MSKVIINICIILLFPLVAAIWVSPVQAALTACPVQTDPNPLISNSSSAKFIINVRNNKAYSSWKVEFKCGAPNLKDNATLEGDTDISYTLNNSGTAVNRCEFSPGPHDILVKAVVGSSEVDQCVATYLVVDEQNQCKLTLNPERDITSATTLTVSGTNLVAGGRFKVYFDNLRGGRNPLDFLNTPDFSGYRIPNELLTPGSHKIDIRNHYILSAGTLPGGIPNPLDLINILESGPPLCPVLFTVCPPSETGCGVIGTGTGTERIPRSLAGGKPCGNEPDNPGIQTAVGCIHTSPKGFVKDFLTFGVGISGGLAFLMMLLGAFQMLTSAGNPETLQAGRERFTNAIIGLMIIIFAVLLLQIFGFGILRIPGFGA